MTANSFCFSYFKSKVSFSMSCCIIIDSFLFFFFSRRRRHTRFKCDWSSDVCSSDLWADEVDMRTGVDSLLGRVAEFAPLEPEEAEASAESAAASEPLHPKEIEVTSQVAAPAKKAAKQAAGGAPTVKSVRIALARLDRMMNTVGELVINRTRMVGRAAVVKLVDAPLIFSERLQREIHPFYAKNPYYPHLTNTPPP